MEALGGFFVVDFLLSDVDPTNLTSRCVLVPCARMFLGRMLPGRALSVAASGPGEEITNSILLKLTISREPMGLKCDRV